MSEHTKEPWKVIYSGDQHTSDIDARPEGFSFDVSLALNVGNGNAHRIVACVNACAGIPNEKLESWVTPPEGQLGAPHGTWAQQLAAAGQQQVELLIMLDMLCNGLAWNIENHPDVMNESDSEALLAARGLLKKFGVNP